MPSPQEFAASIKAKYPQYAEIPDDELVTRVLDKHPVYRDRVSQPQAAPAEVAAPEPPPQSMGLGEMASSAVGNLPGSAWQFAKDVTAPIHSPIETAKGLGGLAAGAFQKAMYTPSEQAASGDNSVDALVDFVKERYGGLDEIKRTVAEDPAGFLADIAGLGMGGGGLAVKAAGTASRVGKVGAAVQKAGRAIDPARLASAGAGRAGKAASTAVSEVLGLTTGASAGPIKVAFRSGRQGGTKGKAFLESIKGNVPMDQVVEEARAAVGNMHKAKMDDYKKGIKAAFSKGPDSGKKRLFHGTSDNVEFGDADHGKPLWMTDNEDLAKVYAGAGEDAGVIPYRMGDDAKILDVSDQSTGRDILDSGLKVPEAMKEEALYRHGKDIVSKDELADLAADFDYDAIDFGYATDMPGRNYLSGRDRRSGKIVVALTKKAVKRDVPGKLIDFDKVKDIADKAMGQGRFKGVDISESTAAVRTKLQSRLNQWEALDPVEFHTVEGMDALRKSIGDVVDSAPYGTPERRLANEVYFAVRKSVEAQAPGYGKVLKGYHEASKHLKDLERALSLGKSAASETALRKLQAVMRNDVASAYGKRGEYAKQLVESGADNLEPTLAGQALQPWTPRALASRVGSLGTGVAGASGMISPYALPLVGAASPRVVGTAAYRAGQASSPLAEIMARFAKLPPGTGQASFQTGRAARESR